MTEWNLLLALVRPGENSAEVRSLITSGVAWQKFVGLANRHGLGSFAASRLLKLDSELLPQRIEQDIRIHFMHNTARQVRAEHQLAQLARAFRDANLPMLSFKGPTLVQTLYGEASLREYGDLDILVRPEEVPASKELLVQLGYETEFTGSDPAVAPVTRFSKELTFHHEHLHPIDLHWDLNSALMPSPLDTRAVWSRTGSTSLQGESVRTLGLEDQLIYVCYHGGKHMWSDLSLVCDAGWLVARHPEIDWARVVDLARHGGCSRFLLLGLRLASDLLAVPIPEPIRLAVPSNPKLEAALVAIKAGFIAEDDEEPEAPMRVKLGLLETRPQQLRYLAGVVFAPMLSDWREIRLPRSLYWLYYPLRIARLLWKYAWLGVKRVCRIPRRQ